MKGPHGAERGAAATELVLVTPLLILLLLFVTFVGRLAGARSDVVGASRDAARVASLARTQVVAETDAGAAAAASLDDAGIECSSLDVIVRAGGFAPGATVSVDVRCTVEISDLALLRLPGARTVSSTSVEVVDRFRGVEDVR